VEAGVACVDTRRPVARHAAVCRRHAGRAVRPAGGDRVVGHAGRRCRRPALAESRRVADDVAAQATAGGAITDGHPIGGWRRTRGARRAARAHAEVGHARPRARRAAMESRFAGDAALIGRAHGRGVRIGGRRARRARRRRPARQRTVVGEAPARPRAGVRARAAVGAAHAVDTRRTRRTRRAVDAVAAPTGRRRVVAHAHAAAQVPAGVAMLNTHPCRATRHAAVVRRRGADHAIVAARVDAGAAVDDARRGRAAAARVIVVVAVDTAARPVAHRVAVRGIDARGAARRRATGGDAVVRHARRRQRGRAAVEAGAAGDAARGSAAHRGGVGLRRTRRAAVGRAARSHAVVGDTGPVRWRAAQVIARVASAHALAGGATGDRAVGGRCAHGAIVSA